MMQIRVGACDWLLFLKDYRRRFLKLTSGLFCTTALWLHTCRCRSANPRWGFIATDLPQLRPGKIAFARLGEEAQTLLAASLFQTADMSSDTDWRQGQLPGNTITILGTGSLHEPQPGS